MENLSLKGLGVAIVTPFKEDLSIDYDALSRLINHIIEGEADYLVVLGTTAETPTLSEDEKGEICRIVKVINKGRLPLVLGIGANDTYKVVERIRNFDLTDFSAILSVVPYYNKPTQEGIYLHFKTIAELSPLPIIVYNIPGRTGVNMTAKTTLRLANDCPNIIGIKEASGNLPQIEEIINKKPDSFKVISGDDCNTLPLMKSGASGVISVVANIFTKDLHDLTHACLEEKFEKAEILNEKLKLFYKLLFEEGNPAGIKSALSAIGLIKNILRLPLTPVSRNIAYKIETFINTY